MPMNGASGLVKLSDVAALAGVSLSTVSRVLNRRKYFDRLSQGTVERVQKAAEQLKYRPHHVAQTLATNRSMVIGIYVHVPTSFLEGKHYLIGGSYAGEIIGVAEQFLRPRGYDLLVINLSDSRQTLGRCAEKFHSRQVDGILLMQNPQPEELCYLSEQNVPAVAIDYSGPEVPVSYVRMDNTGGIGAAVDHLVSLGHRNIGFLGSCHPESFSDWEERHQAYLARMAHHQLPVKYDLHWPNTMRIERTLDFQFYEGVWATDFLVSKADRPTALVAMSDGQAFSVARRLAELGLRCPEDMSIVGFDDSIWARWSKPRLTTISHSMEQMAIRSCQILLDQMERWYAGDSWPTVHEMVKAELVVRESTGTRDSQ